MKNGPYVIVEVKGNLLYEDPRGVAKTKVAKEYATKTDIEYLMMKGIDAVVHLYYYLIKKGVVADKAGNILFRYLDGVNWDNPIFRNNSSLDI